MLVGCATTAMDSMLRPDIGQLGPQPYRVGPLQVWVRAQPEVEVLCRLREPQLSPRNRVYGCYLSRERVIISAPDPYVLLHEFKHFFEDHWHN